MNPTLGAHLGGQLRADISYLPRSLRSLAARRARNRLEPRPPGQAGPGIERNVFVEEFERAPLAVYRGLQQRRLQGGHNFRFEELAETFDNIDKHISWFLDSVPAGRLPEWGPTLEGLKEEMLLLETRGLPYRDSLLFVEKWIYVLDYVSFRRLLEPELERLGLKVDAGTDEAEQVLTQQIWGRMSLERAAHARYPVYWPRYTAQTITKKWAERAEGSEKSARRAGSVEAAVRYASYMPALRRLLNRSDVILFPSYNDLNAEFFTRTRQVPMFLLGLLRDPNLNADGQNLTPLQFFEHDIFHAGQLCDTFWRQLEKASKSSGLASEEVYARWSDNVRELNNFVRAEADEHLRRAKEIVLFTVLHEPMPELEPGREGDLDRLLYPAVVGRAAMAARLVPNPFLDRLEARYQGCEFEDRNWRVAGSLPRAVDEVRALLNQDTLEL